MRQKNLIRIQNVEDVVDVVVAVVGVEVVVDAVAADEPIKKN